MNTKPQTREQANETRRMREQLEQRGSERRETQEFLR